MQPGSPPAKMKRLWHVARRVAVGLVLAAAAVMYVALERGDALALGLILGGAASLLRYRLKYTAVLTMQEKGAGRLVRSRFYGYLINAAALAAAFWARPVISPWTAIAGLFVMNVCVVAVEMLVIQEDRARPEAGSVE